MVNAVAKIVVTATFPGISAKNIFFKKNISSCKIKIFYRSDIGNRGRRSTDDYFGGKNYLETSSKRNGSCSQIRESSSTGSVRQVRVSSTDKGVSF